jgi:hypothetical protein
MFAYAGQRGQRRERHLDGTEGWRAADMMIEEPDEVRGVVGYKCGCAAWRRYQERRPAWHAVDMLIEEQTKFVAWWKANVSKGQGGDRKSGNQVPRSAHLIPMLKAESETQISHQQVSRWRRELPTGEKYRSKIWMAGHYQAMAVNEKQLNQQSLSNEHYTRPEFADLPFLALGHHPQTCGQMVI